MGEVNCWQLLKTLKMSQSKHSKKSYARLPCSQAGTQQPIISTEGNKPQEQPLFSHASYKELMQILQCCSLFPTSLVIITSQEPQRVIRTVHRPKVSWKASTSHSNLLLYIVDVVLFFFFALFHTSLRCVVQIINFIINVLQMTKAPLLLSTEILSRPYCNCLEKLPACHDF